MNITIKTKFILYEFWSFFEAIFEIFLTLIIIC